jgi:hypothetical protein
MSISPLYTGQGNSPPIWEWGQNYGWCHFENYNFKSGEKTHVRILPGGTPWRMPTEYYRDIYNIVKLEHIRTSYPNGSTWDGLPFGGGGDVFFALNGGGWSPGNAAIPNFDQNAWNGATTGALAKLANGKADLGSNIGEGKQTIRMVAGNASKIWRAMLALKKGQFSNVLSELGMNARDVLTGRYPANLWLEYQFGWKPLLNDIHDGYTKFHEEVGRDLIVTGKSTQSFQRSGSPSVPDSNFTGSYTVDERASCRLDAIISIPELRQANQWNLVNPLSVAWELVPWSFAIDWFVPVGNTLNACTASAGLDFLSGSVTQVRETKQETRFTAQGDYTIVTDGTVKIEKFQMRRNPVYSFPDPSFYAKTKNPFSETHTRNALALWNQTLPIKHGSGWR